MPLFEDLFKQYQADQALNAAGSVMGSAKAGPREAEARQGPLMSTILQMLDLGGLNPGNAPGSNAAGIFRDLGYRRQSGELTPQLFAAMLMEQPKFARYKQLVEGMVRRGLGSEFPVYRGKSIEDPLIKLAMEQAKLPAATAVTTNPQIGKQFANTAADEGKSSALLQFIANPESVLGLLPRRKSGYGNESEMLIDPRWAKSAGVVEAMPGKRQQFAGSAPQAPDVDLLNYVLNKAIQMPERTGQARTIPGAGAKSTLPQYLQEVIGKQSAEPISMSYINDLLQK